ncbi:hypothetical protein BJF78_25595 [Pseudonocardia sp. CNS-139]|nr:hypothetical protein BJF78_25595 [Pseudonocardia sp. CNS-139]
MTFTRIMNCTRHATTAGVQEAAGGAAGAGSRTSGRAGRGHRLDLHEASGFGSPAMTVVRVGFGSTSANSSP